MYRIFQWVTIILYFTLILAAYKVNNHVSVDLCVGLGVASIVSEIQLGMAYIKDNAELKNINVHIQTLYGNAMTNIIQRIGICDSHVKQIYIKSSLLKGTESDNKLNTMETKYTIEQIEERLQTQLSDIQIILYEFYNALDEWSNILFNCGVYRRDYRYAMRYIKYLKYTVNEIVIIDCFRTNDLKEIKQLDLGKLKDAVNKMNIPIEGKYGHEVLMELIAAKETRKSMKKNCQKKSKEYSKIVLKDNANTLKKYKWCINGLFEEV